MADLAAIRKRLVDEAGRFDLVVDAENDDYTDQGANQVINDAIAWLNEIRSDLEVVLDTESFELLVADTDTNYWSDTKPHLLVNASRRALEARHRNHTGRKEWDDTIIPEVHQIHANRIKESIDADILEDPLTQGVMQG